MNQSLKITKQIQPTMEQEYIDQHLSTASLKVSLVNIRRQLSYTIVSSYFNK